MREWTAAEERPLGTRSVIASALLGVRPPRLSTRVLVRACALFDISDGAARVALSRMTAAGELTPDGRGYALAGPLLARSIRQDRSADPHPRPWSADRDGWLTAIVTTEPRPAAERVRLRKAATALRLAELRDGVWIRPDNLEPVDAGPEGAIVGDQCLMARSHLDTDAAALAARLWDLDGWDARARRLTDALVRSLPALDGQGQRVLAEGFVLSAAVRRHLHADPLLPPVLLPAAWGADDLRHTHRRWLVAFDRAWIDWTGAGDRP